MLLLVPASTSGIKLARIRTPAEAKLEAPLSIGPRMPHTVRDRQVIQSLAAAAAAAPVNVAAAAAV